MLEYAVYLALDDIAEDTRNVRQKSATSVSWDTMPQKLLLIHSEISEAADEHRKNEAPTQKFVEEIADAVLRLFTIADYLNRLGFNFSRTLYQKTEYNSTRDYYGEGKRYS